MMAVNDLAHRFERWLDGAMPTLNRSNSIDVHFDELCGRDPTAQEQLDAIVALFQWVVANLADKLAGKIVMLMIPLRNGDTLDPLTPEWGPLASQLSRIPPSIYVVHVTAFLQADPAQRYIAAAKVPTLVGPNLAPYYQCWRNADDPEDDGWARDVRVVSTAFVS
jgi:hypothetical protein